MLRTENIPSYTVIWGATPPLQQLASYGGTEVTSQYNLNHR